MGKCRNYKERYFYQRKFSMQYLKNAFRLKILCFVMFSHTIVETIQLHFFSSNKVEYNINIISDLLPQIIGKIFYENLFRSV